MYEKTVNFDEANDGLADLNGFRVVKFLDLWCYMSWQNSCYALVNKNVPFSFSGLVSLKSKNRFPIPYGDRTLLTRRLACDFQGRLARFAQLDFSSDEIYLYAL